MYYHKVNKTALSLVNNWLKIEKFNIAMSDDSCQMKNHLIKLNYTKAAVTPQN